MPIKLTVMFHHSNTHGPIGQRKHKIAHKTPNIRSHSGKKLEGIQSTYTANYLTKMELYDSIFLCKIPYLCPSGSVQVVMIPSGVTTTRTDIKTGEIQSHPSPFWRGSFAVIEVPYLLRKVVKVLHQHWTPQVLRIEDTYRSLPAL